MRTYRRLLGIFYRNALMNELEYRVNFGALFLVQLFWLSWSIVSVRIPFMYADRIAGWSYPELLIVLSMFYLMKGYLSILLEPNLSQMSDYIRTGTLDYILTKPIDSQFMVSLRNLGLNTWATPLMGGGLLIYGLWLHGSAPSVVDLLIFVLVTLAAMVVLYSFNLVLQSLTFWFTNLEGADNLVDSAVEAGRYPVAFYEGWVRTALTSILPVALLTTFPTLALLGRAPLWLAPLAVVVAIVSFVAASAFWRIALRSYTSASS